MLTVAGYTAVSASPADALAILSNRVFDLIVTSGLSGLEVSRIYGVADGAEVITLSDFTPPTLLLFFVDERLRQLRMRQTMSPDNTP